MMFFLHKMDCGVLGAVEVEDECWREEGKKGARVGELRGQRTAGWWPERRAAYRDEAWRDTGV